MLHGILIFFLIQRVSSINLLPYAFYLHHEACVFCTPSSSFFVYFSSMYLSNSTDYHNTFFAAIFHMCMYIKNFWWAKKGKNVLKIEEGRGGFGWTKKWILEYYQNVHTSFTETLLWIRRLSYSIYI